MHQPHFRKPLHARHFAAAALFLSFLFGLSGLALANDAAGAPLTAGAKPASADDLLPPEQAFAVSARFRDAKTIELNYKIADGYYMYRKRFRVTNEPPQFKITKIVTPSGLVKQDATFGRVETYRKSVQVLLPIKKQAPSNGGVSDGMIKVAIISQGCADVGVCHPPYRHDLTLVVGSDEIVMPTLPENAPALSTPSGPKPASIADMIKKVQ
jgi:thioredoxin:protein disulfide reductase